MTDENEDAINAAGSWDSEWTFYAQKDKTATDATGSPTVSFPAAGARDVWSGRVPVASGGYVYFYNPQAQQSKPHHAIVGLVA